MYRHNSKTSRFEALAIRRRVTYDFYDFIIHPSRDTRHLTNQINGMSCDEKLDLLSMDFARIYYRLWGVEYAKLNVENRRRYITYHDMFIKRFKNDGGRFMRHLMQNSKSVECIWEIPKGRKVSPTEGNLNCAIREFYEETGITPNQYTLQSIDPCAIVHYSNGVRYENYYYIAKADDDVRCTVDYNNKHQLVEVVDVKWVGLEESKYMGRLGQTIRTLNTYRATL